MASYRELLAQTRAEIEEVSPARASELLQRGDPPLFVDVREQGEWDEGHIPGAAHIPRGNLESRIDGIESDRGREIVVYCASGSRSAFAAKTLAELGYENVVSLAEGFREWKSQGHPWEVSRALDSSKRARYSRHVLIPEVGEAGQLKLLDSRILLVGAGGLGSPAALYLAAAGVGTIGLIDADVVDASNLQRQVLHSTTTIGEPKVDSARRALEALNPDVTVRTFQERLTSENVDKILSEGWDVIIDGADNFPTRYLVNDASVWHGIPVVHGSIFRFEGQVTVFKPASAARGAGRQDVRASRVRPSEITGRHAHGSNFGDEGGPCYRCLFPQPPPPELAPSCAEGGVLGVLPGVIGSLQASEALKLALGGIGDSLVGRLLLFDALAAEFNEVQIRKDPNCPVCGEQPTITEYVDYVEFCAGAGAHA
jgi:molybdopterin/thiamine biosynthesis adenylyltransferase/rhodanese-related sulfurtransferase